MDNNQGPPKKIGEPLNRQSSDKYIGLRVLQKKDGESQIIFSG